MKRSFLKITIVLSTILLVTGSRSFGESKIRTESGGFNRSLSGNQGAQTHSVSRRPGNLNFGNRNPVGGGSGSGKPGGVISRNGFQGIKLPFNGNASNGQQPGNGNSNPLSGRLGNVVKPDFKVSLPKTAQNQTGNTIVLPNGKKTKSVAVNVAQILNHKTSSSQVQPHIQHIVKSAPKHLCGQPHFSWWVDVCHHHCQTHYGCWNIHDRYWDCWTPCNWQVVQCQQFQYYVGLSGIHVPDMQAYGVQTVVNGSPAHLAGLMNGDLILTVNGQPVFDPNLINAELPKGRLDLQVIREGAPAPLLVTVFPRLVQTVSF